MQKKKFLVSLRYNMTFEKDFKLRKWHIEDLRRLKLEEYKIRFIK